MNSQDVANIPSELRERPQCVNWRYELREGEETKVPYRVWGSAKADSTKPESWGGFGEALAHQSKGNDGVGYVFSADDPYAGVDLDHCRDAEGEIAAWAQAILADLDSYTEVSPSGHGVHIILRGTLPLGGNSRRYETGKVEMYSHSRFFTVTGQHLDGTPLAINERSEALAKWHAVVFGVETPREEPTQRARALRR